MPKPTAPVKPIFRYLARPAFGVGALATAAVSLGVFCVVLGLRGAANAGAVAGIVGLALGLAAATLHLQRLHAELARHRGEMEGLGNMDALTGVANRTAFERELDRHCKPGADLALMLIDVDNLRSVNDSLGYGIGDAVLQGTARRIQACVRTTDMVCRLSGDEFAVLLPRVGGVANAETIARRIVDAVQRPHAAALHNCTVGASMGVAMAGTDPHAGELLRNADVALLSAKQAGKRRYVVYCPQLHSSEMERLTFERELRTALDQNQFVLHYQPMVDSANGRILGVEALVRWHHPDRGLVPPLDFIPVAEATGLIIPLGAWVLREACTQAQRWRTANARFQDFLLSVNVSARQLFGTQLENDVVAALAESGLDPHCLVLEIVESQMMADISAALRQIASLKQIGVRIAIDDFGTGYSSLGQLQNFPVDFLKLDKSFTDNITESAKSQELMRTVAQLSRSLAIATVAEGVETVEQADVLQALDVNLCQGFFFARPIDAESISLMLQRVRRLPERTPVRASAPARGGQLLSVPVPKAAQVATPNSPN
ncbi:MAG: EAL domain-containing protein [Candidatus Dormibacteria bacterium]|jgi:diguanylate cyclase (GGDEF)-like protein